MQQAAAAAAVTDISVLELSMTVAQVPEGALQLWQQGLLPVLVSYCRQLLRSTQGSLGLLDVAALGQVGQDSSQLVGSLVPAAVPAAAGASAPEVPASMAVSVSTAGAYAAVEAFSTISGGSSLQAVAGVGGSYVWTHSHQQWCLLLGLLSTLLQQLSRVVKPGTVEDVAMQLLIAAEPRLLLAIQLSCCRSWSSSGRQEQLQQQQQQQQQGPLSTAHQGSRILDIAWGVTGAQPVCGVTAQQGLAGDPGVVVLTLANLLEAQRALFFVNFMAPHLGIWELQRPGSVTSFRAAAASLIEFVAAPSLQR
jgi:hypothetical protein